MRLKQILKGGREPKYKKARLVHLLEQPFISGICTKVTTMTPKKPNSALRKIARVKLSNGAVITAYIPGEAHKLQEHHSVLIRGGRVKDCPGVSYKVVRGKYDSNPTAGRVHARSKYGTSKSE